MKQLRVPGDKSLSHRALLLGGLAASPGRVSGLLESDDVLATKRSMEALGAHITQDGDGVWQIVPLPTPFSSWADPADVLDCGNSGTTIRLMSGLLAGLNRYAVLTGDASLRRRPMARVLTPLRQMGAHVYGRDGGKLAPLTIQPVEHPLQAMAYRSPVASAQVKSALMLAALWAEGELDFHEPVTSRDHTERMLQGLGIQLTAHQEADGYRVVMPAGQLNSQRWEGMSFTVPGDVSSAAFFMVWGSLQRQTHEPLLLPQLGLNPARTGIIQALQALGARLELANLRTECGGPVGDLLVYPAELRGSLELQAADIPAMVDELPILAVAAAFNAGTVTVSGAEELRHKESDRIAAVAHEWQKLGITVDERPDGFAITGNPDWLASGKLKPSALLEVHHDHRIAMALRVMNALADPKHAASSDSWAMDDPSIVTVSFPGFEAVLTELLGG